MPSHIHIYNYDIFISYRQKDNKGDRWVSECFYDSKEDFCQSKRIINFVKADVAREEYFSRPV
jgi:hypothetical protein